MNKHRRLGLGLILLFACKDADGDTGPNTFNEELLDPANCQECHPVHYEQWLSSMHAYAAEDPVFRAMNAKGQRETNGELGEFCVQCHAPMAVELGLTEDGLNLDEVPQHLQGVTCYFCHNAESVEGSHNNPVRLAMNGILRGSITDPVDNEFHGSGYSRLLDGRAPESSALCGSCHDIVTPGGTHIERTYLEWQESLFSAVSPVTGNPEPSASQCNACHSIESNAPVAEYEGVGQRSLHSHFHAGVDVAITDFPDAEQGPELRQKQLEIIELQRLGAVCSSVCVEEQDDGSAEVTVWLHNEGSGHGWPSGSMPDRRAWIELQAFGADPSTPTFSVGVVGEGESIDEANDGSVWLFKDILRDADGMETHDFWEAVSYESSQLQAPAGLGSAFDDVVWVSRTWQLDALPTTLTSRLRLRAIAFEVLDELIESGDLDPVHRDAFATFELESTQIEWPGEEPVEVDGFGTCAYLVDSCLAPPIREVLDGN